MKRYNSKDKKTKKQRRIIPNILIRRRGVSVLNGTKPELQQLQGQKYEKKRVGTLTHGNVTYYISCKYRVNVIRNGQRD